MTLEGWVGLGRAGWGWVGYLAGAIYLAWEILYVVHDRARVQCDDWVDLLLIVLT